MQGGKSAWLFVLFTAACAPDTTADRDKRDEPTGVETGSEATAAEVDAYVDELGELDVPEAQPPTEVPCDDACPPPAQVEDSFCDYQKYAAVDHFDRFVALQPNSATLWPGVVVRGADARHGVLTPLGVELAPVTFSISLENLAGSPVGHMAEPSLSAFREARNAILANDVTGATPASFDYQMSEVHSASQLSVAIGADVSWPGGPEIAASFDFTNEQVRTRLLVSFMQTYYTVDVDTHARPSDFFVSGTSAEELAAEVGPGNPPVYVQSITYGRRVVFTVESNAERQELEAALLAAYQGVNVEASVEHASTLAEASIHAFVYGGAGSSATQAIEGFEGVVAFIHQGGDYSKDSPGAPIAYKLAYLDNATTKLAFASEYAEQICTKNRAMLRADMVELDHVSGGDIGGDVEMYGYVALRAPIADKGVVSCDEGGELYALWLLDTGQWVSFDKFGSWIPESPVTLTLEDVAVGDDQQLCLFTEIWENDDQQGELSANDFFGTDALMLSFQEGWTGTHVLRPRGDGENAVDVYVDLKILD